MQVTDYVSFVVDRFAKGYVFTYDDFDVEVNKKESLIKALNRLAEAGKINKLSKGKYYKPEQTAFGNLQPKQSQIVKDLLEDGRKIIGYLTGLSIYNQFGLTTQISNVIQIGKNQIRSDFKRGYYTISFIKQNNTITKENIPLLQLLDAIRYVKKIPDASIVDSCKRLLVIINDLSDKEKKTIVRLSLKYTPATRALLGAILDDVGQGELTETIYKTLNPITKYKLSGANKILSTTEKWNII